MNSHKGSSKSLSLLRVTLTLGLLFSAPYPVPAMDAGATRESPPRMDGAGEIDSGELVSFEINLACETAAPRKLEVSSSGGDFGMTELVSSFCRDDPALDPGSTRAPMRRGQLVPAAGFDTLAGGGRGTWRGEPGAWASFTFADGEGAMPDYAEITITRADGEVVLDVGGVVQGALNAWGTPNLPESPGEDPQDARHSAVVDATGRAWGYRCARLPSESFIEERQAVEIKPGGTPTLPPKIHPELADRVARGDPDDRTIVMLNLHDSSIIQFFPDLWRTLRCDDPLRHQINPKILEVIQRLSIQRKDATGAFLAAFQGGDHTIVLMEQFWLVNGFVADVRLGDVGALADRDDVIFIEPAHIDVPPPMVDSNPGNDISVGRQLMHSDSIANQSGMNGSCIGLLDTGVHDTHVHFNAPPGDNLRIDDTDCDAGGPSCQDAGLPNYQSVDNQNHGTGSASILSGNDVYGPNFRGVTDIMIDSWKVYPTHASPTIGLLWASVVAFQRALEVGDRVIVAELQIPEPMTGIVATAADNAFDAGAVVVASAGNCAVSFDCTDPTGTPAPMTIRSPANAHRVLGIGAYHMQSLTTPDYQSYGPTDDLRIKPDLQTPTDAESASRCSPDDPPSIGVRTCLSAATPNLSMLGHGGTSGSVPFAGGVAALVRNRLRKFGTWQPGNTYARMILKGDRIYPYDEREGAGRLRLDTCTVSHWGKVHIQPNVQTLGNVPAVEIPITVASGFDHIEAAIWWPETATGGHNDVDLYLIDPANAQVAFGVHDHSVFERVEVSSPTGGGWTLKIKSYTYLTPQTIYWALDLVGCDVVTVPDDLDALLP